MQPVWIEGSFGWLHTSPAEDVSDVAVLFCPPVSWDALRSHHSTRVLADRCAVAGYPTLRLSYPGTGDARDLTAGEEHWATWQASVSQAADWLRTAPGAKRLVLAGLRLGAMLATLVGSAREDVAGLLLQAPVLRGKSYMRQLSVEAQMENRQSVNLDDGLEFLELSLSAASVAQISAVDLRQAKLRPGLEVGIFQAAATRLEDDCANAWIARGAKVTRGNFAGLESMLLPTLEEDPPLLEPRRVLEWLQTAVPVARSKPPIQPPVPSVAALEPFALEECRETAVQFGEGGVLSGILCQPLGASTGRAVVIVNTGRDPHYGIARFGVGLARRLAAVGIASLRFDFAGLGDSMGTRDEQDVLSALLATDRSRDIRLAVDVLEGEGYREIGLHGLCSGAYHAFHAALLDSRINTLLLVNFPVFRWQNVRLLLAPKHYVRQLLDMPSWRRLMRGEVNLRSIMAAQAARIWERVQNVVAQPSVALLQSFPYRAMAALSQRNVRTLFLFSAGDQGLEAINQAFGRMERGITTFEGVTLRIVPGLDHVLTSRSMRDITTEWIIRFLNGGDGAPPDVSSALPATGSAHRRPPEVAA